MDEYLSLGVLAGALVLAVADEFDDAALVGGEAGGGGRVLVLVLMLSAIV